ncbi:unnamed protein product, partial [Chrysoparadoxa australica]
FGPLSGYLLYGSDRQSPQRVEWIALRNLDGASPEVAHLVMEATAKQSKRVQKPRQHIIVSWAHDDQVSEDQMLAIMDQTLSDLGLAEHQAMYVAHNDTEHQHVHAIINRVHPDTSKVAKDNYERLKLRRSLMRQEQKHSLTQTPYLSRGHQPQRVFSEIELAKREEREEQLRFSKKRCQKLRESFAYSFKTAGSWSRLDDMLRRRGYELKLAGRGVRLTRNSHYAKLSDVVPPKLS